MTMNSPKEWDTRIKETVRRDGTKKYTPQVYSDLSGYLYYSNLIWRDLPVEYRLFSDFSLKTAQKEIDQFIKAVVNKQVAQTNYIKYP